MSLPVACLLTRWYSLSLEATLQAIGFEDDVVSFINSIEATADVASSALAPDARAWAAQHVQQWRRCAASETPLLIFQEDVVFASDATNVMEATKAMIVQEGMAAASDLLLFLGAASPDDAPQGLAKELASSAGGGLVPVCSASPTCAYILWPQAARTLLNSLPLDVPVADYLSRHIAARKVVAMMAVPALVRSEVVVASDDLT